MEDDMKRWKMIVSASLLVGSVMSAAVSAEETVNFENPGGEMLVDAPVSYGDAGGEVIVDAPVSYEDAGGEVLGDAPVSYEDAGSETFADAPVDYEDSGMETFADAPAAVPGNENPGSEAPAAVPGSENPGSGAPATPPANVDTNMAGKTLDFLSTDLEGNRVIGKNLYAENTITLVILWGTWSPDCMNVLPELAQLQERLQGKGCGIVGLDYETTLEGDEALQAAKAALDECGIEYPNAVMPTKLNEKVADYPTAFFVNRDGIVLTAPITGASVDSYEQTINALLERTIEAAAEISLGNSAAQAAGDAGTGGGMTGTAGGVTQDPNNMGGMGTAGGMSQDPNNMGGMGTAGGMTQDPNSMNGTGTAFGTPQDPNSMNGTGAAFGTPQDPNSMNGTGAAFGMPQDQGNSGTEPEEEVKTMVVAKNVNMRDAPHGNIMRVVPSGTTVKVLGTAGENDDWYQIEIYGIVGYVYYDHLRE